MKIQYFCGSGMRITHSIASPRAAVEHPPERSLAHSPTRAPIPLSPSGPLRVKFLMGIEFLVNQRSQTSKVELSTQNPRAQLFLFRWTGPQRRRGSERKNIDFRPRIFVRVSSFSWSGDFIAPSRMQSHPSIVLMGEG